MTNREQFNREYKAAWDAWARRADLEGNALQGILLGCALGMAMWVVGLWIAGWLR